MYDLSVIFIYMCAYVYIHICNGCNGATGDLPDMHARSPRCMPKARGLRAYISGKSLMTMLQLLCITLFP